MCGCPLSPRYVHLIDTERVSVAGSPAGRVVVTATVLLVAVATVTAQLAHDNNLLTTQAAASPAAAALQLLASLALVGAGLVVWFGQARRSVGPATLGAAVAFMGPVWIGSEGSPTLLRSAGAVVAPFLLPCLFDVAAGYPDRGDRAAWRSRLVVTGYAVTAAYVVIRAALYDPFLDPDCWSNCLENTFLVHADPDAVVVLDVLWSGAAALLGAFIVLAVAAARARTRPVEAHEWPVVIAATVGVVTQAVRVVLSPGTEDPRRELLQALFLLEAGALLALAATLAWATWRREQRRATAMGHLAEAASEAVGIHSLTAALALATGRPDLEIGYWVPEAKMHVDTTGQPLAHGLKEGDVSVLRGESPVALIRGGGRAASVALVEEALGPAARLALDNERLRAEEMYHVQRVAESRARILTASDQARRELERDLHDGAQQRLLAVMYSLQMAATAARGRGDLAHIAALDEAVDECRSALAELRDLAHGTFPAILDTAGLAPALADLGDRASVVLSVEDHTSRDLPAPVAHAAYLAVGWALVAAAKGGGHPLRVRLDLTAELLVVTIDGAPHGEYVRITDRVRTLGGQMHADDGTLRMEIPCD